jgi:hypothetical protein
MKMGKSLTAADQPGRYERLMTRFHGAVLGVFGVISKKVCFSRSAFDRMLYNYQLLTP